MKKLTFFAVMATCAFGANVALARSELICVKPTPGAPALCGLIAPAEPADQGLTFEGWIPIPSGGQNIILNNINEECSEKFLDWNEYASKGETARTHLSCRFDEEAS